MSQIVLGAVLSSLAASPIARAQSSVKDIFSDQPWCGGIIKRLGHDMFYVYRFGYRIGTSEAMFTFDFADDYGTTASPRARVAFSSYASYDPQSKTLSLAFPDGSVHNYFVRVSVNRDFVALNSFIYKRCAAGLSSVSHDEAMNFSVQWRDDLLRRSVARPVTLSMISGNSFCAPPEYYGTFWRHTFQPDGRLLRTSVAFGRASTAEEGSWTFDEKRGWLTRTIPGQQLSGVFLDTDATGRHIFINSVYWARCDGEPKETSWFIMGVEPPARLAD